MKLNWTKIIHETYVELYKNSIPPADFDELVRNATINEFGERVIPFDDYSIEEVKIREIIQSMIKKYKIPKRHIDSFNFNVYLGCSPKTKKDE